MKNKFDPSIKSKGLGDTIAKVTHYTGISKLTKVITEALGIEDCGCDRRRENLNNEYSYTSSEPKNLEGEYEVIQNIRINNIQYNIKDVINIDKQHPLYSLLNHYINLKILEKIKI